MWDRGRSHLLPRRRRRAGAAHVPAIPVAPVRGTLLKVVEAGDEFRFIARFLSVRFQIVMRLSYLSTRF
jgi:hypothetical protein